MSYSMPCKIVLMVLAKAQNSCRFSLKPSGSNNNEVKIWDIGCVKASKKAVSLAIASILSRR